MVSKLNFLFDSFKMGVFLSYTEASKKEEDIINIDIYMPGRSDDVSIF